MTEDSVFLDLAKAERDRLRTRLSAVQSLITVFEQVNAKPEPVEVPAVGFTRDPQPIPTEVAPRPSPVALVRSTIPPGEIRQQKTPARVALLRQLVQRDPRPDSREMADALNALPGVHIPKANVSSYLVQWLTPEERKAPPAAAQAVSDGAQAGGEERPSPPAEPPAPPPPEPLEPVMLPMAPGAKRMEFVGKSELETWAAKNGVSDRKHGVLNLSAVNAKRREMGLGPFFLEGA